MKSKIILLTLLTGCLLSCSSLKKTKPGNACADYIAWFTNPRNGMIQAQSAKQYKLICMLTNSHYEAIAADDGSCAELLKALHAKNKTNTQMLKFTVKLTDQSGKLNASYQILSEYLKDDTKNNFRLVYGTDEFTPVFYHFENNTAIAPNINFIVGFELPVKLTQHVVLQYTDTVLGMQHFFSFNQHHLNQIPKL